MKNPTLLEVKNVLSNVATGEDAIQKAKSHNSKKIIEKLSNFSPDSKSIVDMVFGHKAKNLTTISFSTKLLDEIRDLMHLESNVAVIRLALSYMLINACTNENFKNGLNFSYDKDGNGEYKKMYSHQRDVCKYLSSLVFTNIGPNFVKSLLLEIKNFSFVDSISVGSFVFCEYRGKFKFFIVEGITDDSISLFDSSESFSTQTLYNQKMTKKLRLLTEKNIEEIICGKNDKIDFPVATINKKEQEKYEYIPDPNDPFAGSMNSPTYGKVDYSDTENYALID